MNELEAGRMCKNHAKKHGISSDMAGKCQNRVELSIDDGIDPDPECEDCPIIEGLTEEGGDKKPEGEEVTWTCKKCKEKFQKPIDERPTRCECCHKNLNHTNLIPSHGPYSFFDEIGKNFVPLKLAEEICQERSFMTLRDTEELLVYENGVYSPMGEQYVKSSSRDKLIDLQSERRIRETVLAVAENNYIHREDVNPPDKLCLENGIFDIEAGEFTDHTPEIAFTSKIPVHYDPEAECPNFKEFLSQVLHPEDIPAIQEAIGYCLLKSYPYHKIFMFHGQGANGKTTLLKVVTQFLGEENVSESSIHQLITDRFAMSDLYGKLANICPDISNQTLKYTANIKGLAGGDRMRAEKKYKPSFSFVNHAKMMFSANALPPTEDHTLAFYRRWLIIDFSNTFTGQKARNQEELIGSMTTPEELSGIFNYALEGLRRLLENNGFSKSQKMEEIRDRWISLSDSLHAFVKDYVVIDPGHYVTKDGFMEAYGDYIECVGTGKMETKQVVGSRLPTLCRTSMSRPRIEGKRTQSWANIRFKTKDEYTGLDEYLDFTNKNYGKSPGGSSQLGDYDEVRE